MAVRNGAPDEALGASYPFEDRYVQLADGTTMHYIEKGRAGLRRPTVLLLHGNPTWSFLYRRFMEPLSRVARVVAVDHVGYGRSDHPTDPSYHTLERHIANLEEFVDKAGLRRVVPVVQDWGGPIGLGYAVRHPERVSGLVALNAWAFTDAQRLRLPWWYRALNARGVGEFLNGRRNLYVERLLPRLLRDAPDETMMQGYRHPFLNKESRAALVALPRMAPDGPDHPEWATMQTIQDGLADFQRPAMVHWGAKDPAFPVAFADTFHNLLPDCEVPVLHDDAGHFLQEDAPQRLVPAIESFLERT